MTIKNNTRKITARKWSGLALSGMAASMVAGTAGHADWAKPQTERLWFAASEGGEGGESGAIQHESPDVTYLARLGLVEGHLRAAVFLYAKGMHDDAVGLAGHPEAEMMEEVRASLVEYGAPDFTPQLEAVGEVMADEAAQSDVDAAMKALADAIHSAETIKEFSPKIRMEVMEALTRAAAIEYDGAIKDGTLDDPYPYYEAYGFIEVVRAGAQDLIALNDAALSASMARVLQALDKTQEAFETINATEVIPGDPAILYGVAAEVELIGFGVK